MFRFLTALLRSLSFFLTNSHNRRNLITIKYPSYKTVDVEIKIVMLVKRATVAGSAVERRQLNGPRRVLPKVTEYEETFRLTSDAGSVFALR